MTPIIVSGALANKPLNGGNAWTRLHWVLGFRRLGFDAYFVEQIREGTCVDQLGAPSTIADSINLQFFTDVAAEFGLAGALISDDGCQSYGMDRGELLDLAADAALLLNIGGHLTVEPIRRPVRRSVYLDDDPGYTQFWSARGCFGDRLYGHDLFYTYGQNIGSASCPIPTVGIEWRGVRPPVVLDQWPVDSGQLDRFTTVASWRGAYGPVEYGGVSYGQKVHEFRRFAELPARTNNRFEIALDIHPAEVGDIELLAGHGWQLVDPATVARSPAAYRAYLAGSGAEFSAAQGVYVQTGSGWFSDRTACYLASGKPALVQDTGFPEHLPTGLGLLAFHTQNEALAGVKSIARDYEEHCHAARALAEAYFDSDRIVGRVAEEIGITP
jgi:hypothetical protein